MPRACASVIDEFRKAAAPSQPAELREQAEVMLREMEALDLFAQGRHAEAFAMMDRAAALQARMPKPIGRPFPVKDVNELYGELAAAGEPRRRKRSPGSIARWRARRIAAARCSAWRARYRNAGDAANAKAAYKRFLTNYRLADPGLAGSRGSARSAESVRPRRS